MNTKAILTVLLLASLATGCTSVDTAEKSEILPERVTLNAYDVPFTVADVENSNVDVEILGRVSEISQERYFISENPDLGTEEAIYFRVVTIEVIQSQAKGAPQHESFLIHSDLKPTNDLSKLASGDIVVVYGNEINSAWTGEPLRVPELIAKADLALGVMTSLKHEDQSELPLPSWVER